MTVRAVIGYYPNGKKHGVNAKTIMEVSGVYDKWAGSPDNLIPGLQQEVRNYHNNDWRLYVKREVQSKRDFGREVPCKRLYEFGRLGIEWVYIIHTGGIDILANIVTTKKNAKRDGVMGFEPLTISSAKPGEGYGWVLVREDVPFDVSLSELRGMTAEHIAREVVAEERIKREAAAAPAA